MERQYIEFDAPDHALVLSDALGAPGDDEVLISVHHAGINRADLLQRLGLYPPPPDASPVPGLEVAGNIVAVGKNVSNWRQGDRVCALTHGGGYASLALARGDHCLALPDTLSTEVGAALPEALLTVWYNLFQRAALTSGETVLIQGGSSGIGSVGIQMAKAMGCIALSTAGSEARCRQVEALGATFVANHRESLFDQFSAAGYKEKIDVVLDMAGGDAIQTYLDLAAPDGRIACIGVMRGVQANINLATIFMKRLSVTGSTLRRLDTGERAACFERIREHIWPHVLSGTIAPTIAQVYPLDEVLSAHEHMSSGAHFGKLVLSCQRN